MSSTYDYQSKVTHRLRLTLPVTVEVECYGENMAVALGDALTMVGRRLSPEGIASRYSWDKAFVDALVVGNVAVVALPLKPVPPPPTPEGEEE